MNQVAKKTHAGIEEEITVSFGKDCTGVGGSKLEVPKPLIVSNFYQVIGAHQKGKKFGPYFLRGLCNGRRSDNNMKDVQLIVIDGDKGLDANGGIVEDVAPDPLVVHEELTRMNLSHVLYTSHSHAQAIEGTDQLKVKWRAVIWFKGADWRTATLWIVDELNERGLGVVCVPEMLKLSIPWFRARVAPDRVGTERKWTHYGIPLVDMPAEVMRHPAAFQLIGRDRGGTRSDIDPVPGIGRRLSQEDFLALFEAVKEMPGKSGQYMVRCPAHHDNDPSLHVTFDASTGKTVVHCYSECETVEVLNVLGLNFVNLPEQNPRTGNKIRDAMGSGFAGVQSQPAIEAAGAIIASSPILTGLPLLSQQPDMTSIVVPDHVERPIPDEILTPPGLMGKMVNNIMDCGMRGDPVIAYSAMLAGLSFFSLNNYRYGPLKTPLALYIVQIARTGAGKEDGRRWLSAVAARLGLSELVPEQISSGPALLKSMSGFPIMLYPVDEYGMLLKSAKDGNRNIRELIAEEMKFFGKGCGTHGGKKYAEAKRNIAPIKNPYLVKYATTTSETLVIGLTEADIASGHINRNLLFKPLEARLPMKDKVGELDEHVVDCTRALAEGAQRGINNLAAIHTVGLTPKIGLISPEFGNIGDPITHTNIMPSKKARSALHQYGEVVDNKPDSVSALWGRAREQAIVIATLYALADWAESKVAGEEVTPHVELKHVEYAVAVVNWSTENWVELTRDGIAEDQIHELAIRVLKLIRKAKVTRDKRYQHYLDKGLMPRSFIAGRIRKDPFMLDKALTMLTDAEDICRVDEVAINNKTITLFHLKASV